MPGLVLVKPRGTGELLGAFRLTRQMVRLLDPLVSSIQYGTITLAGVTSNTASISSVDTARSVAAFLGHSDGDNSNGNLSMATIDLTNATTVTAERTSSGTAGTNDLIVSFVVIQFAAVVSLQKGTITIGNTVASATATITSVSTSRSVLFFGGWRGTSTGTSHSMSRITLTNATTVTATRSDTSDAVVVGYAVLEF